MVITPQGHHVLGKESWRNVALRKVDKVPCDIDGLCVYSVTATTRINMLEKCRDGRPWKHDSRTTWSSYDTVRYKNCGGGYKCPNFDCQYFKQFSNQNQIKFDKYKVCSICGAIGTPVECTARKYIATNGNTAHIYHYGKHTCVANIKGERPVDLVAQSIKVNPDIKPSAIQGNIILAAMRDRKPWQEIEKTVKRVTNKKIISNEKIKQRRSMQPQGNGFKAVAEYKKFADEKDCFYIYAVNENKQYVFKTSNVKMKIAKDMDCNGDSYLAIEYCHFDGKVKRTRDFTSLTASVYHPLLQKQVPLAVMECKSEDTMNIEIFWREFNKAYKEVNCCENNFSPTGWVTDMSAANFSGLERIYGETVMDKIKGCEFHYKKSINKYAKELKDDGENFKEYANDLLTASTPEAYEAGYVAIKSFLLENNERKQKISWLNWWNDRRKNIFRAFTGYGCPRVNQAEVVHASWTNRGQQGLSLLESAEFDTRDSLLLEGELNQFIHSAGSTGCGLSLRDLTQRTEQREVEAAEKKGCDLIEHGVSAEGTSFQKNKKHFSTNSEDGCNPPKQRKTQTNSQKMFEKRMQTANIASSIMKIRKHTIVSKLKRTYKVASSTNGTKNYDVAICNIPSCTCADFKKNGKVVFCKHIVFLVTHVLSGSELMEALSNRYITDMELTQLFQKSGKDVLPKYLQEKSHCRKKKNFMSILREHEDYSHEQAWLFHKKRISKCPMHFGTL